uniref:Uncharacterized protein n=1 Tax=Mycolicibacterium gilvum (strain PYR-GCK) TaxID=350054 RepID=A4T9G0_MYCGI|nr:hypothetical protein Mflv_2013 [Mycolicibacterium gilvum PYR-GCK]
MRFADGDTLRPNLYASVIFPEVPTRSLPRERLMEKCSDVILRSELDSAKLLTTRDDQDCRGAAAGTAPQGCGSADIRKTKGDFAFRHRSIPRRSRFVVPSVAFAAVRGGVPRRTQFSSGMSR